MTVGRTACRGRRSSADTVHRAAVLVGVSGARGEESPVRCLYILIKKEPCAKAEPCAPRAAALFSHSCLNNAEQTNISPGTRSERLSVDSRVFAASTTRLSAMQSVPSAQEKTFILRRAHQVVFPFKICLTFVDATIGIFLVSSAMKARLHPPTPLPPRHHRVRQLHHQPRELLSS